LVERCADDHKGLVVVSDSEMVARAVVELAVREAYDMGWQAATECVRVRGHRELAGELDAISFDAKNHPVQNGGPAS
jgi:hypothetical protein